MDNEIDEVVERVEELESRIDEFAERYEVEELESRIDEVEHETSALLDRINTIETQLETWDQQQFENRIDVIETQLGLFLKGIGKIFNKYEFLEYIKDEGEEK